MLGPTTKLGKETHERKYRSKGETFREYGSRVSNALADSDEHFFRLKQILREQRFLPGGRIQSAVGSPRNTTAFNCFVAPAIEDSMEGIMGVATYGALTMKRGGGIGYDFSTIRPSGGIIRSLDSPASGPVSFMEIYNSVCKTVSSAGNRRGAQMAVLRIDHPDIEAFIDAKSDTGSLNAFNLSVGLTNKFMEAKEANEDFDLVFDGTVYKTVNAARLYDKLMRATWDWAEPGVLLLDTINEMNNLWYCETIAATNPCAEQPLPPNGACLLGSFNLTKYVDNKVIDYLLLGRDVHDVVRAMDNVIDETVYPLPEQEREAKAKRRMGNGVAGLANAIEYLGYPYGSDAFCDVEGDILRFIANEAYMASSQLAAEKGAFPLYDEDDYPKGKFITTLDQDVQDHIREFGIRNSHLLSIAPTGTISICADSISGGIEPVFSHVYDRSVVVGDSIEVERVQDYGVMKWGLYGKTANECSIADHMNVLKTAQQWVDSSCSKTVNVGDDVTFKEFKEIYTDAWKMGLKGITTFRAAGKRYGVLNEVKTDSGAEACFIDEQTGQKECS